MDSAQHTVALFVESRDGVRLVARTQDKDLVELVRDRLAREHRRQLTRRRSPGLQPVPPDDSDGSD